MTTQIVVDVASLFHATIYAPAASGRVDLRRKLGQVYVAAEHRQQAVLLVEEFCSRDPDRWGFGPLIECRPSPLLGERDLLTIHAGR